MRSLTVQIPKPCQEHWDDMTSTERGRFCAVCQKTVVDYTTVSDQELVRMLGKLAKSPETSCGRFRDEQLNRPLVVPNQMELHGWRHWLGVLTMSLFGWQTARAQPEQADKQPVTQQSPVRSVYAVVSLPTRTQLVNDVPASWTITGKVVLVDSSGNVVPVFNATVSVRRVGTGRLAVTDSAGTFTLLTPVQPDVSELTVWAYAPNRFEGGVTFTVPPSATSIVLNDIILHKSAPVRAVTGGGMAVIQAPSRLQKLKRKLFR